jgi:cytochrome P450
MEIAAPAHVPKDRVFDFDIYLSPLLKKDPYRSVVENLPKGTPRIFWTPRNGGHWVVPGAVEALEMLRDTERFSSEAIFPGARKPSTLPNQSDPPAHTEYRAIIAPAFTPRAVKTMEEYLRALSLSMIEEIYPAGRCEFIAEIAREFPVSVFLTMADAPTEHKDQLLEWTEVSVRSPDPAEREAANTKLGRYVMKIFEERRGHEGVDLLSMVLKGRFQGRPLNEDELLGMGLLLFLGGLDTVASTLSFIMLFLGQNPGHYRQLVDEPSLIPSAVEELVRTHSVASVSRGARYDMEYMGLNFKRGERIFFMSQVHGLDDRNIADPLKVDFRREISPHLGFGAGPHRCIGSHLARTEIRIFLEEWTRHIPAYTVDIDGDAETRGGTVWSPVRVPLKWDVKP